MSCASEKREGGRVVQIMADKERGRVEVKRRHKPTKSRFSNKFHVEEFGMNDDDFVVQSLPDGRKIIFILRYSDVEMSLP